MNCAKIMDKVYEQENMSLLSRVRIGLHLLICPACADEVERLELAADMLHNGFFPRPPDLEESVMAMIAAEEGSVSEAPEAEVPGGFSTRGWVIAGVVMLISLAAVFLSMGFNTVAVFAGMSFLIPIGITIGIALTSYGALFIGSHLKELVERFGL